MTKNVDKDIETWTKMYENTLNEGCFVKKQYNDIDNVVNALNKQKGLDSVVKVVVGNKFYNIKDIYPIEDDDTSTYVCIEVEENK